MKATLIITTMGMMMMIRYSLPPFLAPVSCIIVATYRMMTMTCNIDKSHTDNNDGNDDDTIFITLSLKNDDDDL